MSTFSEAVVLLTSRDGAQLARNHLAPLTFSALERLGSGMKLSSFSANILKF